LGRRSASSIRHTATACTHKSTTLMDVRLAPTSGAKADRFVPGAAVSICSITLACLAQMDAVLKRRQSARLQRFRPLE